MPGDISPEDYLKIKDKEKIMLLDVREEAERHIAKLDGGLWIPLMELPKRLKELDKKKEIICYCRTGGRSSHAAEFLRKKGFGARNLSGGLHRWHDEVDNTIIKY